MLSRPVIQERGLRSEDRNGPADRSRDLEDLRYEVVGPCCRIGGGLGPVLITDPELA